MYYNEDLTKIKPKSVAGVTGTSNLCYPITVSILISQFNVDINILNVLS